MERLEQCLQELKIAVNGKVKDQSLVADFSNCLQTIKMDQNLVHPYCRVLFSLYDLSNSPFLINLRREQARAHLDEMALAMKMCVLRMLARMVAFFNDHPHLDQPLELTRESLEIMVLLSRVFLDLGKSHSAQIKQIYPLCVTFYDAFPQELPLELHLIHCVNILELLKSNVDGGGLDVQQFRRLLQTFFVRSRDYNGSCNYVDFVHHIAFEVVLKLLKKGSRDQAALLTPYLTQKMADTLNSLTTMDRKIIGEDNSHFRVSPFYELYLQIKESGIGNISEERLRLFISKEEHFKDPRLFDVVALTSETLPLEIWFELNLNSKVKNDLIAMAYRCFVFVVDSHLQSSSESSLDNPTELLVKFQADERTLLKLLKLAQMVMLNLLREKKDQGEPIINILKRLIKILVQMVVTLYPQIDAIREYADKIQLICSKHALADLARSITCVSFYYELLMGTATEEAYSRFTKTHLLDKSSQLFKTIKLAYEFQSNRYQPDDAEQRELLNNEPYLALLFQKDIRASAILKLNMHCFAKLPEKYQIYFLLLSGFLKREDTTSTDLLQLATHMEECLIIADYSSINRLDVKYLGDIEKIWMKILQNQKYKNHAALTVKTATVLLYLASLRLFLRKIVALNMGILLNRYSKLLKIFSFAIDEISSLETEEQKKAIEVYQYLAKLILSWSLERLKVQPNREETCEAGYLVLIDLLHQFLLKYQNNPQTTEFFKFVRFEILCITDSVDENELACERNVKLLKLYSSSIFIKKPAKLKILRKLIREDLMNDSRHASLAELSDLIALTEDTKEKKLYAEYMIRSFGEEGKKFLLLQCSIDASNFDFLQELGEQELYDF